MASETVGFFSNLVLTSGSPVAARDSRPSCGLDFSLYIPRHVLVRFPMCVVQSIDRAVSDPVAGGFYTVREAARLLGIGQPSKITAWLQGHQRGAAAIIKRQYEPIEGAQELGFWDLIEVRFVEHFRKQGVSLQALRKAAEQARKDFGHQHPFAMSNVKFLTDRVTVFSHAAQETGDKFLLNLVTKQYAMYVVLEEVLAKGIEFDPGSGMAREWRPTKEYPHVALNPLVAYGQPAILPDGVPTAAIFRTWKAENGSYLAAADWYEITEDLAREAVEFELGLPE